MSKMDKYDRKDIKRMLLRASELVDSVTLKKIDKDNPSHMTTAVKATCAQVEYWIEVGESQDIEGTPASISAGNMDINFQGGTAGGELAPRARRILLKAGLLSRSIKVR